MPANPETVAAGVAAPGSAQRWYSLLGILFLALLFGLGLTAATTLRALSGLHGDLWNGARTWALESKFDQDFPGRELSVNLWTALSMLLFDEARPGAILGRDGWLYSSEEFSVGAEPESVLAENFAFVTAAQDELRRAHVPLLVVLLPEKAQVYPDFIGSHRPGALHAQLASRLLAALDPRLLTTVDLLPVLRDGRAQQPTFFRTDTHWTPWGAKLAADALLQAATTAGLARPAAQAPQEFRIVADGSKPHRGDLFNFLPLEPWFPGLLPAVDEIQAVHTERPKQADDADNLLGDIAVPEIALVGSSYSANPAWNFAGDLEAGFGEPVANYAKEIVGPFPPMAAYLRSADFAAHPPRLLIWEVPLRALLVRRPEVRAFLAARTTGAAITNRH